tara:strand:+ start:754 stop:1017 length:264 start_codon:yes stop_codon:yes gene_type:complete
MALIVFFITISSLIICQDNCILNDTLTNRSLYNIGDYISQEDQNTLYPVCNGSGNYNIGDSFSLSDLNGDLNGGDYKISIISMNATW